MIKYSYIQDCFELYFNLVTIYNIHNHKQYYQWNFAQFYVDLFNQLSIVFYKSNPFLYFHNCWE